MSGNELSVGPEMHNWVLNGHLPERSSAVTWVCTKCGHKIQTWATPSPTLLVIDPSLPRRRKSGSSFFVNCDELIMLKVMED